MCIRDSLGNVDLTAVQVTDNLAATFPSPATFSVSNINLGGLTAPGTAYNGSTQTNLLAGTDTLTFGTTATISFNVTFDPNSSLGPFSNQASASATGTSDV